ncbi:MAG: hypothetical protein ACC660_07230 [Acidimicrobiales bacterium]
MDDGGAETSAELNETWVALAEVARQLEHATDHDVRLDLQKIKADLRERMRELSDAMTPVPTRRQLEDELESRQRQLNRIFNKRINTMTQTSGDGASPGGYGAGAQEINEAIDKSFGRGAIERRIVELQAALAQLDADEDVGPVR